MDDGLDAEIESVGDDNAEPEYFDTGSYQKHEKPWIETKA